MQIIIGSARAGVRARVFNSLWYFSFLINVTWVSLFLCIQAHLLFPSCVKHREGIVVSKYFGPFFVFRGSLDITLFTIVHASTHAYAHTHAKILRTQRRIRYFWHFTGQVYMNLVTVVTVALTVSSNIIHSLYYCYLIRSRIVIAEYSPPIVYARSYQHSSWHRFHCSNTRVGLVDRLVYYPRLLPHKSSTKCLFYNFALYSSLLLRFFFSAIALPVSRLKTYFNKSGVAGGWGWNRGGIACISTICWFV